MTVSAPRHWLTLLVLASGPFVVRPAAAQGPVDATLGLDVRAVSATDGRLMLATREEGLGIFVETDGVLRWVHQPLEGVADIRMGSDNRYWIAGLGGVAYMNGHGWTHIPDPADLGSRVVFTLSNSPSGKVWAAGTAGAAVWNADQWAPGLPEDSRTHAVVHQVLEFDDGTVWYAGRRGATRDARTTGGEIEHHLEGLNIRAMLLTDRGLLLGTSDGFRWWTGDAWETEFSGTTVYPSLQDTDGTIWAGSVDRGLLRFDGARWEGIALPEAYAGAEVYEVARGRIQGSEVLWVATSRGLWRLEGG